MFKPWLIITLCRIVVLFWLIMKLSSIFLWYLEIWQNSLLWWLQLVQDSDIFCWTPSQTHLLTVWGSLMLHPCCLKPTSEVIDWLISILNSSCRAFLSAFLGPWGTAVPDEKLQWWQFSLVNGYLFFFSGDITQKGYEKKRSKLLQAYLPQTPGNTHTLLYTAA